MDILKPVDQAPLAGPLDEHRGAAVLGGLAFVVLCAGLLLVMILR